MSFTLKEIIESRKAHNKNICLFGLSEKRPMNKYTTPDGVHDVVYFTMVFMDKDGKKRPARLQYDKQLIYGRTKLPKKDPDSAKTVSFPMSKFLRKDIEGGDYTKLEYPKNATQITKEKIDAAFKKQIDILEKNNDEMYKAMCIIASEHNTFWEKEQKKPEYKAISLVRKGNIKLPYIDETADGDTLPFKMFRFNIPIVRFNFNFPKSKHFVNRIGRYSGKYKSFTALIGDSYGKEAKIKKKNRKGKISKFHINKENVGKYMTRKSQISGECSFSNTAASASGINIKFEIFRRISVKKHKSSIKMESISKERTEHLNDDFGFAKVESDVEEEEEDDDEGNASNKSDDDEMADLGSNSDNDTITRHDSEPSDNDKYDDSADDDSGADSDESTKKSVPKLKIKIKKKKRKSTKKKV
jgi:hypothetical protein